MLDELLEEGDPDQGRHEVWADVMRLPKKSRLGRVFMRKARERTQAPEPSLSPPERPPIHEMACICGQLLRIAEPKEADDETRWRCPTCGRRFLATFAPDPKTGIHVLCPMYIDDDSSTGETRMAEIPGEKKSPPAKGQFDDTLEPHPPPQISFVCPCGKKLAVKKETYDKRVRCPSCHVRMLISVVYDPAANCFAVFPVRLNDAPSGDTWLMDQT